MDSNISIDLVFYNYLWYCYNIYDRLSKQPQNSLLKQQILLIWNSQLPSITMPTIIAENLSQNFVVSSDKTHSVFNIPIEKSENDDREYRLIKLANELEILLIHDPKTDKSAASMDVHVGDIHDPADLQGLSHFCEHLLFLGTSKYPKENDYFEYLNKHNGHGNAYTSAEDTNYYFEVGHEFLEGALDRFAQFFIHPLFNADCTEREIRAVDSEYKGYLQNDDWRKLQLEKSLCNPNHPFSQFGVGNLESLKEIPLKLGLDVREELMKHHKKYYSSNIMKLAVKIHYFEEPLDLLNKWVIEKFSEVENKSLQIPIPDGHPITKNELGNQISLKPVRDQHYVEITFPIPDQSSLYETKPFGFLSHIIGHEEKGSILSLLKKKGWANGLYSGPFYQCKGFELFKISIELTEEGFGHYEEVVEISFQFINMLRQLDPKEQERVFKEVQSIKAINFKFQEKSWSSYYVAGLSRQMQRPYPREWILSSPYLTRKYDPASIAEGLTYLRWDNCILTLSSKLLGELDKKERWFGTEYKIEPINEKLLKTLQSPTLHPELEVNPVNEFIPSNFEVNKQENTKPLEHPYLIKDTKLSRLWYKKDDRFWVPKVEAYFMLKTPISYTTPLHHVKTQLYVNMVNDSLTEFSYGASIAGLSYYFDSWREGIIIAVLGYNHKATHLLEKILERVKNFTIDPKRFAKIKAKLKRSYQNRLLNSPTSLCSYYASYIIGQNVWTIQEKLSVLDQIEYEDVQEFYPKLYRHMFFEGIVHGNANKSDAFEMMEIVERTLGSEELLPSQLISDRSTLLPVGKKYAYFKEVFDKKEINSAIHYCVQVGDKIDPQVRAKLYLVGQIASEPCFNQLRTKEQLGYSVYCYSNELVGAMEFRVVIQSEKDTIYLENRIEEFLKGLQETIESFSDKEYNRHVNALIERNLENDKNLREETRRYWRIIYSGYYEFNRVKIDTEYLRELKKSELLEFYKTYIHPKSSTQKKISIHLRSQNTKLINELNSIDVKKLHELISSQGFSDVTVEDLQGTIDTLKIQCVGLEQDEIESVKTDVIVTKIGSEVGMKVLEALGEMMNGLIEGKENQMPNGNLENKLDDSQKEKDEHKLSDENEIIDDIILFKTKMGLGPAPYPLFPLTSFYEK
ncbi:11505_t:CDS:10 [Acaulospora morrowiae]|uniref:11505_t:CDS:1 n=1 Tax=Acaulospora morrowiae TaxID=94023 RepID=A0A9N9GTV0_9GLOM|nr:11505_t:CDS:10 [Acaulospora morrowiae]